MISNTKKLSMQKGFLRNGEAFLFLYDNRKLKNDHKITVKFLDGQNFE